MTDLLFANDQAGEYPQSWYAATTDQTPAHAPLKGETRADICIVGGGYTGLSAALHLAQAGRRVVLLEGHRIGFGASGRNGGQLGTGQRKDQQELEAAYGPDTARQLWDLGVEAVDLVKALIAEHQIDCHLRPGIAWAGSRVDQVNDLHAFADHMAKTYDHELEVLDRVGFHKLCPSPDYKGGVIDWQAGHLHPLRYAQGLARAAVTAGATLHEGSVVTGIDGRVVRTRQGSVRADHVILAANGYLGGLNGKVAARVMPINNFIVATEPLGDRSAEVLIRDVAVADMRFVVNYFRLSHDKRLLFGGGETYGYRFPSDIRSLVRKPLLTIFPSLRDVRLDYAWGGTLGITLSRLPYMAQVAPGIFSASGYSGHGVGTATHAGKLMAETILGRSTGFDVFASLPTRRFPGGAAMRSPMLKLAMTWYALRDRLGV